MSEPNVSILLDSGDLRATLVDVGAAARPLVITFESLSHDPRLDRPGFGRGWLDAHGYDAVHIVTRLNAWYQQPEMAELAGRVRELAGTRARTVTYGSSMGGYAAIRFAGRMGAQAAVAISPQFSIDPRRAPFDDRWAEYARDVRFMWEEPDPLDADLRTAWVFYDPHDDDRLHVQALAGLYPIVPLPLPHAGHPAGGYLMESGLLGETVLSMVDGAFEAAPFARNARSLRRRSAHYLSVLSRRQPVWRPRAAARLAAAAARMEPTQGFFIMEQAFWTEAEDRLEEAEALYRRALELVSGHPRFLLALGSFLVRTGRGPAEGVALVQDIGRFGVEQGPSLRKAAEVLFLAGEFEQALRAADRARMVAPLSPGDAREVVLLRALVRLGAAGRPVLDAVRRLRLRREERRRLARGATLRRDTDAS